MTPQQQKTTALAIAALGLILTLAGPLIPGGERLERNSPPQSGHVTELTGGSNPLDGSRAPLFAGTSTGEIWRYQNDFWQPLPLDFGGHPITRLIGDPTQDPVGTGGGLYQAPAGIRFSQRVAALMPTPDIPSTRLLIGNDHGIHLLSPAGNTVVNAGLNVYRFIAQTVDGQRYLHAGTIGAGVLSTTPDAISRDWPANNQGLPEQAYVYSLAVTQGGKLIAGTKTGLFWQSQPGTSWQLLDTEHGAERILSLYLAPATASGSQRLWIGTDSQLLRTELLETATELHPRAPAASMRPPEDGLLYGISAIRPAPKGVSISAGAVYQWGPVRLPGWHWISISGILLLLIAGWMLPGRTDPSTGETAS
ncbi:ABC transporter substrate-binding protein [Rhabdochromatium marinum]|uniref:ABC transporter substrate-binding protein n=1 Tax=Rhabdochromatium marinum TaxID=48729 RepID=UPI0019034167|nr:ABC transporter substrate-binding protein [Rhabdochromatium marinum]MBK1649452.1 hypothetical protein [Rhabdochromatium marinum]